MIYLINRLTVNVSVEKTIIEFRDIKSEYSSYLLRGEHVDTSFSWKQ